MGDMRVTIPKRLRPYLNDMLRTGLYDSSLRDVVIGAVQSEIGRAIEAGFIPLRRNGRVWRWLRRPR